MLGRHVYRVGLGEGSWTVTKEGEDHPRSDHQDRDDALAEAVRLAQADKPSKIIVDGGDGLIAEERVFGEDPGESIDPGPH